MNIHRNALRACAAALVLAAFCMPASAADEALIAAAKKNPRMTWYTTLIVNQFARPVADAFQKKYGIKLRVLTRSAKHGCFGETDKITF